MDNPYLDSLSSSDSLLQAMTLLQQYTHQMNAMHKDTWSSMHESLRSFQPNTNLGYGSIPGLGPFGQIAPMILSPFFEQQGIHLSLGGPQSLSQSIIARHEMAQSQIAESLGRQQNVGYYNSILALQDRMAGRDSNFGAATRLQQAQLYNSFAQQAAIGTQIMDGFLGTDTTSYILPTAGVGGRLAQASFGMYSGGGTFGSLTSGQLAGLTTGFIGSFGRADGLGVDYNKTSGLSLANVAGGVIELQKRGLVGAEFTVAGANNINDISNKVAFNQIGSQAGRYTQAMAIAKEITGSSDAAEQFKVIDSLTGGGVGQLDPGRLAQMMVQVREISRNARMSLDVMSSLINEGAGMANAMGMSPAMGARMASQNVMLANMAANPTAVPGYNMEYAGKPTFESLFKAGQDLSLGAASSRMFKPLYASLYMLSEQIGGVDKFYLPNGEVNPEIKGDYFRNILKAMRSGDPAAMRELYPSMVGQAGISNNQQGLMLNGFSTFAAYSGQYDVANQTRGQTSIDMNNFQRFGQKENLLNLFTKNIAGGLGEGPGSFRDTLLHTWGIDPTNINQLTEFEDAFFASSQPEAKQRLAAILERNNPSMRDNPAVRDQRVNTAYATGVSFASNAMKQYGLDPNKRDEYFAILNNNSRFNAMQANLATQTDAALLLAGKGRKDLAISLQTAITEADTSKSPLSLWSFIATSLGSVTNSTIHDALSGQVKELIKVHKQLEDPNLTESDKQKLLNRKKQLTTILNDIPIEIGSDPKSVVSDMQTAVKDLDEQIKSGTLSMTDRNTAIRLKRAMQGVASSGKFDFSKDAAAILAHSEYSAFGQSVADSKALVNADSAYNAAIGMINKEIDQTKDPTLKQSLVDARTKLESDHKRAVTKEDSKPVKVNGSLEIKFTGSKILGELLGLMTAGMIGV